MSLQRVVRLDVQVSSCSKWNMKVTICYRVRSKRVFFCCFECRARCDAMAMFLGMVRSKKSIPRQPWGSNPQPSGHINMWYHRQSKPDALPLRQVALQRLMI
jgi:hypothetical protein